MDAHAVVASAHYPASGYDQDRAQLQLFGVARAVPDLGDPQRAACALMPIAPPPLRCVMPECA
jgi:hypothetical protein